MIGQRISHYEVVAKLGAGGMGEVYRARDTLLERDVALKVLPASSFTDPTARARLLREARAAAALNHPHICTIHEVGEAEGQAYIAMELVEGQPLSAVLAQQPLPYDRALRCAIQLAEALAHAHERGVLHRDLKSANVVLGPEGRVKVLDFGLAKRFSGEELADAATQSQATLTQPGAVIGTLAYMAPEQLLGQPADARSDVWALGVVLYEMVAGMRPFQGQTGFHLSSAILNHPPPPLPANVPVSLKVVIERCLEKEPARRYQRASEVRAALEALQSGVVVPWEAWRYRLARLGGLAQWKWLVAGVGTAVFILAAVFVFRSVQTEVPREPLLTRPVTSFVGLAWGASLSPDGNLVAYAHNRYGPMDIFVIPTNGGDALRLTDTPADEITARWSPDGRYIAFVSDRGTGTNIYLIPPLGGAERKIAETNIPWIGQEVGALFCVGSQPWSPDASEMVFCRLHPTGEIALWKVNLRTGAETQLTRPAPGEMDSAASWSFDGKRIAFVRHETGRTASLGLLDPQGGEPEVLLRGEDLIQMPAWLPDGRRLLFTSDRGAPRNLWEMDLSSRRLRQVTSGTGNIGTPGVSANGTAIYNEYTHQVDIYWGPVGEPQEKHQRLTSHTHNNFGARVSPDGQKVLYFSNRTGNYDLWLLDRRTGAERNLTDNPAWDGMGDWSPDGKQIVFLSDRGGALQPWVMNLESGRTRRISLKSHTISFEPHFSGPRWSPDGQAIGFMTAGEAGYTLHIVDPDGANERSPLPGVNTFDWYRDSRHVLYTAKAADGSGVMEMRVTDLVAGKEVLLLRGPTAEMVVSRDGRGVAFVHSLSHFSAQVTILRLAPPDSPDGLPRPLGKPVQLTRGEAGWHVHNGGWSPDGKAIVYTRDADSGSIFVIQNYR